MINIVENNTQMENCPLDCSYVEGADDTWGENLGCLDGKTPQLKNPHIRVKLVTIPMKILQRCRNATLVGDIMYVNKIRFINTVSHHIQFMTVEHIANTYFKTLKSPLGRLSVFTYNTDLKLLISLSITSSNASTGD